MDAAALAAVPLGGGWRLRLGATSVDVISSLAWDNGLEEAQPSVLRLGAALEPRPGWWLAFQQDHLDRQGLGGTDQWRVGAQATFLSSHLAVRAGATQADGSTLFATAGLGGRLDLAAGRLEADYALVAPADATDFTALRHLVEMRWRFGAPPEPPAAVTQEYRDKSGHLRMARIALVKAPKDVKSWDLQLKDKHGRVVRVLHGKGPLPPAVVWDGKDEMGQSVEAEGVTYDLRASRAGGTLVQHHALLAPAAEQGLDEVLASSEGADYGLRATAGGAQRVKPKIALKGAGELAVSQADFDLGGLKGADEASAWEVRIVDAGGKTVRKISGHGKPPRSVRWEGTDDLGQPVESSLGASYEVRVTSASGEESLAAAAPVVSAAAFADLAETADKAAVQSSDLPKPGCWKDERLGGVTCMFSFPRASAELTEADQEVVGYAAAVARRQGYRDVVIDGHADNEGDRDVNFSLSQRRADAVLKSLLEQRAPVFSSAVVKGWADTRPLTHNEDEPGRARNRRVELHFMAPDQE